MKHCIIVILLCIATGGYAQSVEVGYSPVSVNLWSNTESVSNFNLGANFYRTSGIISLNAHFRYVRLSFRRRYHDTNGYVVEGSYNGFFLLPVSLSHTFGRFDIFQRTGAGYFTKPYATPAGKKMNFIVEAGLVFRLGTYTHITFFYSHISNGGRGKSNPGVDNFLSGIVVRF